MKRINTAPVSGMQELLPSKQRIFNQYRAKIAAIFAQRGFQNIETPMIERTEILLAKAGGETAKQIYKVVKTAEADEGADQGLRFDHTVSLARYTVEHLNDLPFPFKVSQIGRNFRGERAQKGRFREFYQCDVDVIGRNQLDVVYDADVIATLQAAVKVLPLPGALRLRISNRKILSGILAELDLEQLGAEVFHIIDHAEKVPPEATRAALEKLQINDERIALIEALIGLRGASDDVIPRLEALGFTNPLMRDGIRELEEVCFYLQSVYKVENTEIDLGIIRGLDYYTGTVFETQVIGHEAIGSVCSGGRYENLASNYTNQSLPGVGGSIGLTRLFYLLNNTGVAEIDNLAAQKPVELCIIPMSCQEDAPAFALAERLRPNYGSVDVVLLHKSVGAMLNYASKISNYAIVVGEAEVQTGQYKIKNLLTGETQPLECYESKPASSIIRTYSQPQSSPNPDEV